MSQSAFRLRDELIRDEEDTFRAMQPIVALLGAPSRLLCIPCPQGRDHRIKYLGLLQAANRERERFRGEASRRLLVAHTLGRDAYGRYLLHSLAYDAGRLELRIQGVLHGIEELLRAWPEPPSPAAASEDVWAPAHGVAHILAIGLGQVEADSIRIHHGKEQPDQVRERLGATLRNLCALGSLLSRWDPDAIWCAFVRWTAWTVG